MAPSLVSRQSAVPSLSPSSIDRLSLDPGLDFVVHDDGMIELTEAGFRRMSQAHSAGLDTVIEVDRRELLRLPAKLGNDPCAARKRQAELIEAHVSKHSTNSGAAKGGRIERGGHGHDQ
jgi:hypothetical protein